MKPIKVSRGNLKRILTFEHPPDEPFPDEGKLALLAVFARCGKRQVEKFAPVDELIRGGWIEKTKSGHLRLCESTVELLKLERDTCKEADPRVKKLIGAYGALIKERFHKDPVRLWNQADWGRYSRAAAEMLRVAALAPQCEKRSPEEILEFVRQTLRAMVYTEDPGDFAYFKSRAWDFWVLVKAFSGKYVFEMLKLQAGRKVPPKGYEAESKPPLERVAPVFREPRRYGVRIGKATKCPPQGGEVPPQGYKDPAEKKS